VSSYLAIAVPNFRLLLLSLRRGRTAARYTQGSDDHVSSIRTLKDSLNNHVINTSRLDTYGISHILQYLFRILHVPCASPAMRILQQGFYITPAQQWQRRRDSTVCLSHMTASIILCGYSRCAVMLLSSVSSTFFCLRR
jgi:hypothetical protein